MPLKPVVIFTVYRRYYELDRAIFALHGELAEDLSEKPDVVVVWASPEVNRLWYFQQLLGNSLVNHLLTREPVPEEGPDRPTTYPESLNIRMGLEFVRETYGEGAYAIVQAADVMPRKGRGYRKVDESFQGGAKAVLFNWNNGFVQAGAWHTNFFGVCLDRAYWPPVATPQENDVLEWMWGKELLAKHLPGIVKDTNVRNYWFDHDHLSETVEPWPTWALGERSSLPMVISGYKPWYKRLLFWRH